jgi:hypothetical protein
MGASAPVVNSHHHHHDVITTTIIRMLASLLNSRPFAAR